MCAGIQGFKDGVRGNSDPDLWKLWWSEGPVTNYLRNSSKQEALHNCLGSIASS